ncbi:hypothetical protein FB451DRAFT_1538056 [Mycena latifolia]|nr:hypothetical protein FB451DRAFT_1538056 [Mycena latifolia]
MIPLALTLNYPVAVVFVVNLPGGTPASAALVADLVYEDFKTHHCFWNEEKFVNRLSHHVLSLHDFGALAECMQAIYGHEAAKQLLHNNRAPGAANRINEDNWLGNLGSEDATLYPDYLAFFASKIAEHGVSDALERSVFSAEANSNGALMLARFATGLEHPIFGIKFGQDFMVAQGLALAVLTAPAGFGVMNMPAGVPEIRDGPPTTLLAVLRQVYDSPQPAPRPYEKKITPARFKQRMVNPAHDAALCEIYAKWTFDISEPGRGNTTHPLYFNTKLEECMWQAVLLLGVSGHAGHPPRMHFILMRFASNARAVAHAFVQVIILRMRPRVDSALAMSYPARPVPPGELGGGGESAWLPLLRNAAMRFLPLTVERLNDCPVRPYSRTQ